MIQIIKRLAFAVCIAEWPWYGNENDKEWREEENQRFNEKKKCNIKGDEQPCVVTTPPSFNAPKISSK